jgi:hypothetical protein
MGKKTDFAARLAGAGGQGRIEAAAAAYSAWYEQNKHQYEDTFVGITADVIAGLSMEIHLDTNDADALKNDVYRLVVPKIAALLVNDDAKLGVRAAIRSAEVSLHDKVKAIVVEHDGPAREIVDRISLLIDKQAARKLRSNGHGKV